MCGIAGYFFNTEVSLDRRIAMTAILATGNDTRGGDSWGYYNGELVKGLKDIAPNTVKMAKSHRLMLHTRKATTGAVTKENAHPFRIGKIIGAHNGMIMNHDTLNRKYGRNHEVDSMHLFSHLNEGRNFDDIGGYGAIEWVDKNEPGRTYLCRMSAGDLAIAAIGKKGDVRGIAWSSNDDHLKAALKAAGLPFFEYEVKMGQVYFVEEGQLYIATDRTLDFGKTFGGSKNAYGWLLDADDDEADDKRWSKYITQRDEDEKKEAEFEQLWKLEGDEYVVDAANDNQTSDKPSNKITKDNSMFLNPDLAAIEENNKTIEELAQRIVAL